MHRLEAIIQMYDRLKTASPNSYVKLGRICVSVSDGLCSNASLKDIDHSVYKDIVMSYLAKKGRLLTRKNVVYWATSSEEYHYNMMHKYKTDERLEAAKFFLERLYKTYKINENIL